jgi:NADH/NAD ratio-sensing transcriptional regulator Rex
MKREFLQIRYERIFPNSKLQEINGVRYNIEELLEKMEKIFHRNKDHNIVLIGMGNLGLALSKYSRFVQRNMKHSCNFRYRSF